MDKNLNYTEGRQEKKGKEPTRIMNLIAAHPESP